MPSADTTAKRCSKCRKRKPVSEFGKASKSKDGLRWSCVPCTRVGNAAAYKANFDKHRDKRQAASREYYRSTGGRIKNLLSVAKGRAQKLGVEFSISPAWVAQAVTQRQCAVTGIFFDYGPDGDGAMRNPFAPSVDKIEPYKGYTDENTRLVCVWYNLAKQDWSDDRVRMIISACAPGILQ